MHGNCGQMCMEIKDRGAWELRTDIHVNDGQMCMVIKDIVCMGIMENMCSGTKNRCAW